MTNARATPISLVRFRTQGYHPKDQALGVQIDKQFKAHPFTKLPRTGVVAFWFAWCAFHPDIEVFEAKP